MNCYEYFARQVDRRSTAQAVLNPDGEDWTYEELDERAAAVAAHLAPRTDPGDRVAVYMLDNDTYPAVVLGAWRAGCAVTPVNYRFGLEEVAGVLRDVRPTVLVTDDVYTSSAAEVADSVDAIDEVVQAHAGGFDRDAVGDPADAPDPVQRFDDDVAIVMHTSGTTGTPKGVVQTHRNVSAQVDAGVGRYDVSPADTAVVSVPLFHVGGLHGATLMSLFSGGSVAIQPAWQSTEWARLVEATDATFTGLVPAMIRDVLNTPEAREYDTSSLRLCFYGGSPAPEAVLREFEETFDVDGLLDYYGQTEAAGVTVTYGAGQERVPGKMGTPVETVRTEVVDLDIREPVGPGERGELLLRGDSVMPRYWEAPDRTETAFETVDGEQWFRTGDVVERDEDGLFVFVDRADDVVLSGGEKVAPTTVERALSEWNAVQAVAVFGTDHERLGEAVTAAVVADEGVTAEDVKAYAADHEGLAGYEEPRRVHLVDSLPRTGSGKVDKRALAERVAE